MKNKELVIEEKRKSEQTTVVMMIRMYCKRNHKSFWKCQRGQGKSDYLCPECKDLAEYATLRSQKCPYIAKGTKTFCSACKTHCYKPEYREKIRKVMGYSGPRMIFKIPGMCIKHLFAKKF